MSEVGEGRLNEPQTPAPSVPPPPPPSTLPPPPNAAQTEPPAEASDEDAHDWLEVIAATLLGMAAIAIAFSAYQSSLWGGQQDAALTESVRESTEAADLLQNADRTKNFDQALFIELLTVGSCDEGAPEFDEFICEQILLNMSPESEPALDEWAENDELLPFESEAYNDALYSAGFEAIERSDAFFEEAAIANQNGDDFELASTLLATVLFFAGISVVIGWPAVRKVLLAAGFVLFIGSVIYLAGLPLA